jgi:hypothetical protein
MTFNTSFGEFSPGAVEKFREISIGENPKKWKRNFAQQHNSLCRNFKLCTALDNIIN